MAESSYTGSTLLMPLTGVIGLKIDQLNFIVSTLVALGLGYPFRTYLGPHRTSPTLRHAFEIVAGTLIMVFLFGNQVVSIVFQSFSCYFLIRVLPHDVMPHVVGVVAMLQLSAFHIWHQIQHYSGPVDMDASASMMINTQRMSALAWSLYDGRSKDPSKLSEKQRKLAISKMPSILELLSYTLHFHGVISGPFCFFKDYQAFIEGTNLINIHDPNKSYKICPSPKFRVVERVLTAMVLCPVVIFLFPAFPMNLSLEAEFLKMGFFTVLIYTLQVTATRRYKYYVAWKLLEAANNNAGLGFYFDEKGEERWDLIDSAYLKGTEFATSIKMFLDNWNMTTAYWLRYVIYDRVPFMKTPIVFCISMFWHGFYPGFYITAVTTALFVTASRMIRRNIRPWFTTSKTKHFIYDIITMVTTRFAISYMGFPFLHLAFDISMEMYRRFYFYFHILALIAVMILSFFPSKRKAEKKES